jgi:predicted HAD superfamily Cof-like phosphohydrolase
MNTDERAKAWRTNQVVPLQKTMAEDVFEFMTVMGQPANEFSTTSRIPQADFELASKLMSEEIKEMSVGFNKLEESQSLENFTEFADGAIDTIYVILWTLNKFGLPADALWREVQRSNMAKVQPDGTVLKNEFGKVQKPAGWTPPDLFGILLAARDKVNYKGGMANHD